MNYLPVFLAAATLLCGCAGMSTPANGESAQEAPEYRTGSIIAKKKAKTEDGVRSVDASALDEVQRNSALPIK
ncbi:MAG: hypothetical protein V4463_25220 [Pseudomonadota bacterium]